MKDRGLKVNYDRHFIKFIGRKIKLIEISNFRKNTYKSPIISKKILNCKTPLKHVYKTPLNPILKTECGGGGPYVQNTFKSHLVLLQKTVLQGTFKSRV